MSDIKYKIPNNYRITEFNGLKGLARLEKGSYKQIWDNMYKFITAGKSYGRIYVAHMSVLDSDGVLKLSNYNGKVTAKFPVYDLRFGAECIYVKTVKPSTGDIEWALITPDLKNGKFIGDFAINDISCREGYYIPVGKEKITILVDNVEKVLTLKTGEIIEVKHPEVRKEVKKEVVELDTYNIIIDTETNLVKLTNPSNGQVMKQGTSIGEVHEFIPIIRSMLGGSMEKVEKELALEFFKFTSTIEHFGHGIILPIMFQYAQDHLEKENVSRLNVLKKMNQELSTGWTRTGTPYEVKIYVSGSIAVGLIKNTNGKVIVCPYQIIKDDDTFDEYDIATLRKVYELNGCKTAKLNINGVEVEEYDDAETLNEWPVPYAVRQRAILAEDIKKYGFRKLYTINVTTMPETKVNEKLTGIALGLGICDGFMYISKKKLQTGKYGEYIHTNNITVSFL